MKVKELVKRLELFDDNFDVMIWNEEADQLVDISKELDADLVVAVAGWMLGTPERPPGLSSPEHRAQLDQAPRIH